MFYEIKKVSWKISINSKFKLYQRFFSNIFWKYAEKILIKASPESHCCIRFQLFWNVFVTESLQSKKLENILHSDHLITKLFIDKERKKCLVYQIFVNNCYVTSINKWTYDISTIIMNTQLSRLTDISVSI